jgi:pilus assembly protein CpaD
MLRILTAIAAAGLVVAGCAGGPAELDGPAPLTPTQRYVLQVEPGVDRIALAVHDAGLSGAQRAAIADLANRFMIEGAATVRIETPAGDDPAASEQAYRAREALQAAGVPPTAIEMAGYYGPDARAPIVLGFETLRAVVPQCGTRWGSLTRTGSNAGHANFGCAVTANLAAQIANPRDIVQPRDMGPTDAQRRTTVFAAYREGTPTAAEQELLLQNRRVARAVE